MSLETSVPNLVSLIHPGLQILGKTQTGVISDFQISSQPLIKKHNSSTSDDNIVMKLAPVTKLNKRNKTTSKNLTMTSFRQIVTSLSFFRFMAKPDSRRRVCKTSIFKISNTVLTLLVWVRYYFCQKNADFLEKNYNTKIKRVLVLKRIFSETTYVCVLTYQISSF